tara:strand:+ start:3955 stop:4131 length:177 start_codon:yes stop_codon:yes gene_type:complete
MNNFYHIYWKETPLFRNLEEEEFEYIWEKMLWKYSDEINYMKFTEETEKNREMIESSY